MSFGGRNDVVIEPNIVRQPAPNRARRLVSSGSVGTGKSQARSRGDGECDNWTAENELSASQQSVIPLASK
jgi:hypothetical protein